MGESGSGGAVLSLLEVGDRAPAPALRAAGGAKIIEELVPMGASRAEEDWPSLWSRVSAPRAAFLGRLEAKARVPALAFATLRHLEKKILLADPGDASLLVGSTYRMSVDLARRVCDVSLPPQADRLICRLTLKGEPVGVVELPGVGVLAGQRIAEAALEGRGRPLLRRALTPERSVHLSFRVGRDLLRRRMLRLIYCVVAAKPKDKLDAARRVKHEVARVARANVPRVLAPRPGLAPRQANPKRQKSVDAGAAAGPAA